MRIFYLALFCITGLACVIAAAVGWKRLIGYFSKGRFTALYRFFIGAAGVLLIAYGIAYFMRLI